MQRPHSRRFIRLRGGGVGCTILRNWREFEWVCNPSLLPANFVKSYTRPRRLISDLLPAVMPLMLKELDDRI